MSRGRAVADGALDPHRQVWASVLSRAADDVSGVGLTQDVADDESNIARDALRWFKDDLRGIGSFIWICHILDLDPDRTRKLILRRAKPQRRRPAA